MENIWLFLVYIGMVFFVTGVMLGVSALLGESNRSGSKEEIYESGIVHTGDARARFSVKFYLMAVFFVIFDLEAVFLFAWAIALHESGWTGYFSAAVFIFILLGAVVYLWKVGALDLIRPSSDLKRVFKEKKRERLH